MPHRQAATLERVLSTAALFLLSHSFWSLFSPSTSPTHTQWVISVTNDLYDLYDLNPMVDSRSSSSLTYQQHWTLLILLTETHASVGFQITALAWFTSASLVDPTLLVPPISWRGIVPGSSINFSICSIPFVISAELMA